MADGDPLTDLAARRRQLFGTLFREIGQRPTESMVRIVEEILSEKPDFSESEISAEENEYDFTVSWEINEAQRKARINANRVDLITFFKSAPPDDDDIEIAFVHPPIPSADAARETWKGIELIERYLSGCTREAFQTDVLRQAATTYRLRILSISVQWLDEEFRREHDKKVDWARLEEMADYYRRDLYPSPQTIWDDAQHVIGPLQDVFHQQMIRAQLAVLDELDREHPFSGRPGEDKENSDPEKLPGWRDADDE